MPPLIEYTGVRKRFGDKVVLDGVDLSVDRGEIVALLGPSGSGKTVMLKLLIGLLRPDAGHVVFDGVDVPSLDERELRALRRRMGFVFQGAALFDSLSVGENVAYAARVERKMSPGEAARRTDECLRLVGLPGIESLSPQELSGGMRKRVAIARALFTHPEVILYDEPTSGLDPANVRRVARLIRELRDRLNNTALVVTHERDLALDTADRLALLLQAKLAWLGPSTEARSSPPQVLHDFFAGIQP